MPPTPRPDHTGTVHETAEEIAAAVRTGAAAPPVRPVAPSPAWDQSAPLAPAPAVAIPWRPTGRPPVAVLVVCDDGRPDGETIRLRADRFVIGRTDGDLTLPHDPLVSARHAEITRQLAGGVWRWVVTDLQSANGLFVRLTRFKLADRAEFLVGRGRYRFDAPEPGGTVDHLPGDDPPTGSTHGWADAPPGPRPPALTELVPGGIGNRVVLTRPEYWIGTDPRCAIPRPDDPFCEPRHARVFHSPRGGWWVEHPKTANGLWVRMGQLVADRQQVQFQVGEQRFRLRV